MAPYPISDILHNSFESKTLKSS